MPTAIRATLNGTNLPPQFSYLPYIPKKRQSTLKTAQAVIVQYAAYDFIIHGDDVFTWSIEGGYPSEFTFLNGLYDTTAPVLYTFTGYWGEIYSVYFSEFKVDSIRGRLFNMSGAFQVICITSNIASTISCTG